MSAEPDDDASRASGNLLRLSVRLSDTALGYMDRAQEEPVASNRTPLREAAARLTLAASAALTAAGGGEAPVAVEPWVVVDPLNDHPYVSGRFARTDDLGKATKYSEEVAKQEAPRYRREQGTTMPDTCIACPLSRAEAVARGGK